LLDNGLLDAHPIRRAPIIVRTPSSASENYPEKESTADARQHT
jgi:hypothetical protein